MRTSLRVDGSALLVCTIILTICAVDAVATMLRTVISPRLIGLQLLAVPITRIVLGSFARTRYLARLISDLKQ